MLFASFAALDVDYSFGLYEAGRREQREADHCSLHFTVLLAVSVAAASPSACEMLFLRWNIAYRGNLFAPGSREYNSTLNPVPGLQGPFYLAPPRKHVAGSFILPVLDPHNNRDVIVADLLFQATTDTFDKKRKVKEEKNTQHWDAAFR